MKTHLRKLWILALFVGAGMFAFANYFERADFSPQDLKTIKISIIDAITKAQQKQSGTVVKAKLEKEESKLVYEVVFIENGKEYEWLVDVATGDVAVGDDD